MRITKLHLSNFRNYEDTSFQPEGGMNILIGQNGQGKSALLESVYLLATSKSHRTSRDSDLIRIGSDWARVAAEVDREEREEVLLEMTLSRKDKKSVRVNKVRHEKIGDIVGQLNAVIFSSADLDMVKSDPSHRRRFMNLEISQVSPQYVYALGRYKRVLEQRNTVLRESRQGRVNDKALEVWNNQLAEYGSIMIERRLMFIKRLSEIAEPVYNRLAGGGENLEVNYNPNVRLESGMSHQEIRDSFSKEIEDATQNDLIRRTSTKGPHRDDICFKVNGLELRAFGSQGQQRSVALAVKLAEIELIEEMIGEPPVALLDDVTAELDDERRRQVFTLTFSNCQTFATTTSSNEIPTEIVGKSEVFEVISGTVRKA